MRVKALVTAAGLSSRMKDYKPLMKVGDKTMAERVIGNLRAAGVEEIVVVTGFRADELEAHLAPFGVTCVRNEEYRTTDMFTSVKLGLAKLAGEDVANPDFDKFLFTPIDVPMPSVDSIRRVVESDAGVAFPKYNSRLGHPIAVDAKLIGKILDFDGDFGLRGALESTGAKLVRLEVCDPGTVSDADTQDEFQKILKLESIKRRIFLVRHGTPVGYDKGPHLYRGQIDLPLSDAGAVEAAATGEWFAQIGFNGRLYASPLVRAYDTTAIIADRIAAVNPAFNKEIKVVEGLKEINVGHYEGLTRAEAEAQYPESARELTEDLYTGVFAGGESIKEAGDRFGEALRDILAENADNSDNILIGAHTGVISGFLVGIGEMDKSELMRRPMPCGSVTILCEHKDGSFSTERIGWKSAETLTDDMILRLYDKYEVPEHIRAHMRAVADYQEEVLTHLEAKGKYYDRQLARSAALLHDIARLKKKHAAEGARILEKEGYPEVAAIVAEHHSSERCGGKVDGDGRRKGGLSLEDILFYSDKRVDETTVVTVEERFAASEYKCVTPEIKEKHRQQREKACAIEKEIFE